ncbi:hypothetical protein L1987_66016 [Smallanthus sonchifolius]|uniref:Uncharacterized protein n=1 Tax=Smallanthus sonchifolius TaxID=185202 RepID=A0ACB9BWC0_9ASTR|nr:hypothetical protein L1987_66016 [Smallanthus sonchifolius]
MFIGVFSRPTSVILLILSLGTCCPHIPEESLVLVENGDLFLFDLHSLPTTPSQRLTGKKVKVLLEKYVDFEKGSWLGCDFSWHPRILIVVHTSAVFLVDSRSENYNITPLLKLSTGYATLDRFLAFSIAGPYQFYVTLASSHLVFLCDIRKPMSPVLHWAHKLANPSYIIVSSLSELRSLSEDATYSRASEAAYGPFLYAWGLPSDISLVARECRCGSCLVKEDFSKDQLPFWINWQQKKDFVLGFGILDKEIFSQLFKPDKFDIVLRGIIHAFDLEDFVINETGEEGFKYKKVFQYLKFDWLDGYLKSDLNRILVESESQSCNDHMVSLADDNEDVLHSSQNLQHFSSYKTHAVMEDSVLEDEKHKNLIFRVGQ